MGLDDDDYPHMLAVHACFIEGKVVSWHGEWPALIAVWALVLMFDNISPPLSSCDREWNW